MPRPPRRPSAGAFDGPPQPPRRLRLGACAALAALFALSPLRPAVAEPPPSRARPAAAPLPPALRTIDALLRSRDPETLAGALNEAARMGAAARPLSPAIEELAARGLPPPFALAALEALGELGARESAPVLRRYLRHRRADLRLGAVRALGRVGGPAAVAALRSALSDPDKQVRGEAASGLAALGASDALDDLYRALDSGVPEAASALGRLCSGGACDGVAGRLHDKPFDLLAPGCEALLFRPPAEVPDAQKVALVRRLHDLRRPEVHRSLEGWRARWKGSPAVGEALARAVEATAPPRRD